jgi:hypothetical protein
MKTMKTAATLVALVLLTVISTAPGRSQQSSCYDQRYQYCLDSCYELSQTDGCGTFASQECLCERAPADCPACY